MDIIIKFDATGKIIPYMNGDEIDMNVSPFLIFLATAGMCSAVFVRAFLGQRGMNTNGVNIVQKLNYDQSTNQVKDIDIHVDLPEDFPEKYNAAIKRVVGQCPVKQHLVHPPSFNVITNIDKKEAATS